MQAVRDAERFLIALMAPLASEGSRYLVEYRPVPGTASFSDISEPNLPADISKHNQYFGVVPKIDSDGNVDLVPALWADVDVIPEAWHKIGIAKAVAGLHPRPSAAIFTGNGVHIYWILKEAVPVDVAIRATKLAALAYNGDPMVCEPNRVLRLPGTYNYKDESNPKPVELLFLDEEQRYEFERVENGFIASLCAKVWEDGSRHALSLSLGALLGRAGWTVERAKSLVFNLCKLTGDNEVKDRVAAVAGSIDRREGGQNVSSADLRTAIESLEFKSIKKPWTKLLDALGITQNDGELVLDGETVARKDTIQEDMARHILGMRDWAMYAGRLHRWTGTHWKDSEREELDSYVFGILTELLEIKGGDMRRFPATIRLSKDIASVLSGWLYAQPLEEMASNLLPTAEGVINLDTLDVMDSDRKFCNTWILPVKYDPEAKCPMWEQFLQEAAPDEVEYLREWVGYVLKRGNPAQKMLWLYGPTTTGKSTFLKAVKALLGDGAIAIQTDNITPYELASTHGKLAVTCSEIPNTLLKTTTFKALVTGDALSARFPYGRPFTTEFEGKILWGSNALPPVDQSEGMWRRIVVVPFSRKPSKINLNLDDEIAAELSGLLNWALPGLARVNQYIKDSHWPEPESVVTQVKEYQDAADTFAQFVEDELILDDPEAWESFSDIYMRYAQWAKEHGYSAMTAGPNFRRELRRFGLEPDKRYIEGKQTRGWKGAKLAEEVFR